MMNDKQNEQTDSPWKRKGPERAGLAEQDVGIMVDSWQGDPRRGENCISCTATSDHLSHLVQAAPAMLNALEATNKVLQGWLARGHLNPFQQTEANLAMDTICDALAAAQATTET